MHASTKNRIEFLQKYMVKYHKKWLNKHYDNIAGLRIDKKNKKGNYSIVFQVKEKIEKTLLNKKNIIPPHYDIKFPDGIIKRIRTDVEQTGAFRFHLEICKKPLNNGNIEVGTIGVFVKYSGNIFGITNYHVAGKDRMMNNEFFFNGADGDISIDDEPEVFTEGIFSNEIDVAFIQLQNNVNASNILIDGTQINGFINGPLTSDANGTDVTVYSRINNSAGQGVINSNAVIFNTGFNNLTMKEIIQVSPLLSQHGDSGGPVLIGNSILGIIVGGDDFYTYVIPFFKIRNFKSLDIL